MRFTFAVGGSVLALVIAQGAVAQEAGPPRALQSPTLVPAPAAPSADAAPDQNAPAPAAQAQEASGLQDIVVTAQRREETIQRAALAITAVSGAQLAARGATTIDAIGRLTPGLQVSPSTGPYATFTVRGITQLSGNAFADPSVAVNVNGVYLASPTAMRGLFYDVNRVEVLKGPQGTLYGRNATAGAINIIPRRPTFTLGGEGGFDVGNYGHVDAYAALNLPLGDTVALRIAGQHASHDGYFSDGTGDEDVNAGRLQLLFQPTPDLSILLSGDYAHQGGKGVGSTLRRPCTQTRPPQSGEGSHDGICFVASPFTALSDLSGEYTRYGFAPQTRNQYNDSDYFGTALNVDWKTGLGTFTLIAAYRKSNVNYDNSAPSYNFIARDRPDQKSLELRLASAGSARLQYVFGAYYLGTTNTSRQNGENAAVPSYSDQYNVLSGWTGALFSQLTYRLTDTLRLTGGLRYTHEEKDSDSRRYTIANVTGPDPTLPVNEPTSLTPTVIQASATFNRVNWKAGVEFDVAPRSLVYANVSTGFKAGGFFYGAPVAQGRVLNACAQNCVYQPEDVTSYVLGSKNRFFGNRLQINAEAFYLNYRNQQVSVVKLVNFGGIVSSVQVTDNAGKSRNYGAEVETDFLLTPKTRLGLQLQYLNSRYQSFSYLTSTAGAPPSTSACRITPASAGQVTVDCTGEAGLRSPTWRILGSVQRTIDLANGGQLLAEVDGRYETSFQNDVSYIPESRAYATARVDLSLGYDAPGHAFSIKAYVDNLTDVATIAGASISNGYSRTRIPAAGNSGLVGVQLQPPRTFGVRGQISF